MKNDPHTTGQLILPSNLGIVVVGEKSNNRPPEEFYYLRTIDTGSVLTIDKDLASYYETNYDAACALIAMNMALNTNFEIYAYTNKFNEYSQKFSDELEKLKNM